MIDKKDEYGSLEQLRHMLDTMVFQGEKEELKLLIDDLEYSANMYRRRAHICRRTEKEAYWNEKASILDDIALEYLTGLEN